MLADLIFVSVVVGLAFITYAPQIVRIYRTKSAAGLSSFSLLSGCVAYGAWAWYFLALGEEIVGWATVLESSAWVWITVLALRISAPTKKAMLSTFVWAVTLAALALVDVALMGLALGFSVLVTYAPAVWAAWRDSAIGGISVGTWLLSLTEGAVWIFWATVNENLETLIYGVIVTVSVIGVLSAIAVRREARALLSNSTVTGPVLGVIGDPQEQAG